ncbi:hypothetical protein KI387_003085 [Taxus chinensis]|uniref:Formate dehydrogenase n=1 Tax=Taxus chinensis TaxID=29808 RepID=A0AA38H069_TAXCH|nr:hypothetical protein KI387_003085 [Taxus chinensis]
MELVAMAMAMAMTMAMAGKRGVVSAMRALSPLSSVRELHAPAGANKVVGVFYKANEYASKNPNFLGCVENSLGIQEWLESNGHQYIVTDDKEGPNCELEKHIPDLHVLISTPFHPAYVTAERIKKAKNLQLLLTAGIGSDHIDLKAAAAAGLTVAEVTGSNVVSVAEDELMRILILMRNFVPGYKQIVGGDWNVAAISYRSYDLEGKTIGTVGAGRIGKELLKRLKPFNCKLLYHDRLSIGPELEKETGATWEKNLDDMLPKCYSGDVWFPQPAPKDHPWRSMPNHAMTPHISGTTIDAQIRYAAGVKDMLDKYFKGEDFPSQNYIVKEGKLASQYL